MRDAATLFPLGCSTIVDFSISLQRPSGKSAAASRYTPQGNTKTPHSVTDSITKNTPDYILTEGGKTGTRQRQNEPRCVPHPRTLRKAREQVKAMVKDGVSSQRIRCYLHAWATWWVRTQESWQYDQLLVRFISTCWDTVTKHYAYSLLERYFKKHPAARLQARPIEAMTAAFEARL